MKNYKKFEMEIVILNNLDVLTGSDEFLASSNDNDIGNGTGSWTPFEN